VFEIMTVLGLEPEQAHELTHEHGLAGPGPDNFKKLFVGVVHNNEKSEDRIQKTEYR
jgi:hypothetical protein